MKSLFWNCAVALKSPRSTEWSVSHDACPSSSSHLQWPQTGNIDQYTDWLHNSAVSWYFTQYLHSVDVSRFNFCFGEHSSRGFMTFPLIVSRVLILISHVFVPLHQVKTDRLNLSLIQIFVSEQHAQHAWPGSECESVKFIRTGPRVYLHLEGRTSSNLSGHFLTTTVTSALGRGQ